MALFYAAIKRYLVFLLSKSSENKIYLFNLNNCETVYFIELYSEKFKRHNFFINWK